MRFTISGAAAALLLTTVAPAGAQAPPMIMGGAWDPFAGFYAGVNVGGGFGDSTATRNSFGFTTTDKLDSSGPVGGVQGGYNWRINPQWLLGVETDFDGSGITSHSGTTVKNIAGATVTTNPSRALEYLGTVRGRIGYQPRPNWLLFASGGFAYGQVDSSIAGSIVLPSGVGASFRGRRDGIQTGWAVGGGSEVNVAPNFGVVLEYLHADLGSFSYNAPIAGVIGQRVSVDNNANIFRIGLNYHFVPPPPPPAPVAAPAPAPVPPKVFIVFFDWDKDVVTPEGHAIIQQAADAYRAGAPVQLQVTGYTDRSGSPGYNQRLSERRANNVAKALAALGVPKQQMIVSGRGENDNRVPTADGVREPQNRRVEIVAP
jgi:opacity protein-like surface antigen